MGLWWGIFKGTIGYSVCISTRRTVQLQRTPPPPPLPVFSSRRRHQRGLLTLTRVGIRHLRSHTGGVGGGGGWWEWMRIGERMRPAAAGSVTAASSSYLSTQAVTLLPSIPPSLPSAPHFDSGRSQPERCLVTGPVTEPEYYASVCVCVRVCVCVLTLAGKVSPLLICCQTFRYTAAAAVEAVEAEAEEFGLVQGEPDFC